MKNRELADKFAKGAMKGKGSNMFIDGNVIYSYGTHFPIAKRCDGNMYMLNLSEYSSSTARHVSYVKFALFVADAIVIELLDCDIKKATATVEMQKREVVELTKKINRARTIHKKATYEYDIKELQKNITFIGGFVNGGVLIK